MKEKAIGKPTVLISLAEAKAWLRVTQNNEDDLISQLIRSAESWSSGYCKRNIGLNDYEVYSNCISNIILENTPADYFTKLSVILKGESTYTELPKEKFQVENTVDAKIEIIDSTYVLPAIENRSNAVKLEYSGGYSSLSLPESIKTAMLLKIACLYDERAEDSKRWLTTAEALLMPHRVFNVL